VVAPLSPAPSLIFTERRVLPGEPGWDQDRLLVLPLDGSSPVLVPAETPGEGGVTGVGWQPAEERFLMSTVGDGGVWSSAWGVDGAELAWPTNPTARGDSSQPDSRCGLCIWTLTPIPGTTLIAYVTSVDYTDDSPSDLVIYNTTTGLEVSRVQVAEPGEYVKLLHSDGETVAVSRIAWGPETGYQYLPGLLYDLSTQSLSELELAGMATLVTPLATP
jgi:hypothetical protein